MNVDKKLYSIYDRCSGLFQDPFVAVNDPVAIRMFKTWCSSPELQSVSQDLDLFFVGSIDVHSGEVVGNSKPEFLYRFSEVE